MFTELYRKFQTNHNYSAVMLMHYHAAEVYLCEIGLRRPLSPDNDELDESKRLELLSGCLSAAQSYFDTYHMLPKSHYAYFPFTIWIQSGLVLMTTIRLALFEHKVWDITHARRMLNVSAILDREIDCINEVIRQ
jgi:hypothetical protein